VSPSRRGGRTPRTTLSRALARRDWSDLDLAARTGLSRAHVNRLKNRRVRPTLRDALLIARALGCETEDVFEAVAPRRTAAPATPSR